MNLQHLYESLTLLLEAKKYDQMISDDLFYWLDRLEKLHTEGLSKKEFKKIEQEMKNAIE